MLGFVASLIRPNSKVRQSDQEENLRSLPSTDSSGVGTVRDRLRAFPHRLISGEWMIVGQSLTSQDGRFAFRLQPDGEAVLTGPSGLLWSTKTASADVDAIIMHTGGDLAVRGKNNEILWHSGTEGHRGAHLVLQDDGNLVIYDDQTPLWASHTGGH